MRKKEVESMCKVKIKNKCIGNHVITAKVHYVYTRIGYLKFIFSSPMTSEMHRILCGMCRERCLDILRVRSWR